MYQCVYDLAPSFVIDVVDINCIRRNLRLDTQEKLPNTMMQSLTNLYATVQSDK